MATSKTERTEEALIRTESIVRALLESAAQAILAVGPDGNIVLANDMTEKMFGYSRTELLGQPLDMLLPDNVRKRHAAYHEGYFAAPASRPMGIGLDLAGRRKDGTQFRVEISLSVIEPLDGRLAAAFVSDITERKRLEKLAETSRQEIHALAGRLLTVQEEERRRVSRELHDGLCQQLASLAFDIGGLVAETPAPDDARIRLRALQARVVRASEEARHIAYQLHPSVLEDLGLTVSLQALCEEFSKQEGTSVDFSYGELPSSLPLETASCVYRVAQEALSNIAKHSHAKHVFVALSAQEDSIVLAIQDDGAGFDPEGVKGKGGLGLVGMEERARLVKGKLAIESQPGNGARITLGIPLPLIATL